MAPAPRTAEAGDYFDREYFQLHPGKRKYLEYLIRLLRTHGVERGRVLDVGSGYGFFLEALEQAGYEPHGLELSPHAVAAARLRQAFADAGLHLETLTTISNFCNVGEGNPILKPLRRIGQVITTPWLGDSLLAVARRDC